MSRVLLASAVVCALSGCEPAAPTSGRDVQRSPDSNGSNRNGLPEQQRKVLSARLSELLSEQPRFAELRTRLLGYGGSEVVPRMEPDLEKLLERGSNSIPAKVTLVPGDPSNCHGNSARLWKEKPERRVIVTGWALSADKLWRQHSWVVESDTLLETTKQRDSYFGTPLTPEEAEAFWRAERRDP